MSQPTNSSTAPGSNCPPRRRRVLAEGAAAIVLLVGIIFAVWLHHVSLARQDAMKAVAQAVEEADRSDPGWRFEDLEAQRRLPPPEQNAALQVLKVKSLTPRDWSRRPAGPQGEDAGFVGDGLDGLPPERQLDERQTRLLRAALERAAPALDEARKLADMPEGRYPITWAADFDSTPCPWSDAVYGTRPLLQFDALLRNQDGDSDGALLSARALLNVGRSLGDEPFFDGPVTHLGCRFNSVEAVERTLAQGQPSDAALARTQKALQREDGAPLLLLHFRGHRAMMHEFLTQVDEGKHRLSELG